MPGRYPGPTDGPVHVYRVYNGDDLIYIGSSIRLWTRLAEHRRYSWWSVTATRVRAELAPDWATGRNREIAAIWAENPRWNLADLSRLIPQWTDGEFAEFLHRWLINDRNVTAWHRDVLRTGPRNTDSHAHFHRLLRRYQLRHGRDFDLSLLGDYELPAEAA